MNGSENASVNKMEVKPVLPLHLPGGLPPDAGDILLFVLDGHGAFLPWARRTRE